MSRTRVMVAMSGGVDSSVACYMLKKAGYECIGATIKTWPKEECGNPDNKACCSLEAVSSAKDTAAKLGIPHYVFDFSAAFKRVVKKYFINEYKKGRTPNPCILCNSEIKFGLLFAKAEMLNCNFVASGHYAKIVKNSRKGYLLKRAHDTKKDQSYFLFNLSQRQLSRILFPLGGMKKIRVKQIARKMGLKAGERPSSQDVCFKAEFGRRESGQIVFADGKVLGRHRGIIHYTVGQRKGLGIAYKVPLYVTKIDAERNIIYVGTQKDTFKKNILAENISWSDGCRRKTSFRAYAKIRYSAKEAPSIVKPLSAKEAAIVFERPQSSPTPGQAVVFYRKGLLIGGGWIKEVKD